MDLHGMSLAFRVSPSAVVALDVEGRVRSCNKAAETLLGISSGQALGKPYPEVFGPSLSDRVLRLFLHASGGKSSELLPIEVTLPSGKRTSLRASAGPLRTSAGVIEGFLFIAQDTAVEDRLREALQRYVGTQLASEIDTTPSFTKIGGRTQVISVLHGDVRGYTTLAENRDPQEVMALLMRFHGKSVEAIEGAQGTVDRYVGDAILAMWNAPQPQENHARLALQGALAVQAATRDLGEMAYGVGVHTGEAVVGNLGSERYMHYTAIGDTVNLAARLQSAAAEGTVVCSRATLDAAGADVKTQPLGEIEVKGRKTRVEAFLVETVE